MSIGKWIGPLTWSFVIIIGGIMINPGGIIPIVTNPAVLVSMGIAGIVLGTLSILSQLRERGRVVHTARDVMSSVVASAALLAGTYMLASGLAAESVTSVMGALGIGLGAAAFFALGKKVNQQTASR